MDISFFDVGKRVERTQIAPGTVFSLQGRPANALILLHSGMAEILDHPSPQGLEPAVIIRNSIRIGLIKGESICGTSGFFQEKSDSWSLRALSECQISVLPLVSAGALASLHGKKGLAIQVLRAAQQAIESTLYLFNNYKYLWHKLASIADALALVQDWGKNALHSDQEITRASPLEDYSRMLFKKAKEKGIALPEPWDPNLFLDRIQTSLDCYQEYDRVTLESLIDHPQYLFLKRLIKKSDDVLLKTFEEDEPAQYYVFQFFSKALDKILDQNRELAEKIYALSEIIFGKKGWTEKVLAAAQLQNNPKASTFLHYLWRFSTRCQSDLGKLLNLSLSQLYPSLAKLSQFHEPVILTPEGSAPQNENLEESRSKGSLEKYKNLTRKILEFSEMDEEFALQFQKALEDLKQQPDKLSPERPVQALREIFSALYWKLYEVCLLKVIASDLKTFVPGIMLHFGLVDETLVTQEQLEELDSAYSRGLSVDAPIPVMTLPYFLEKIFTGEVGPSMNEMGEGFGERLRAQEKMTPKEKAAATLYENTPEGRVRYEIREIAGSMAGLVAGSRSKSLPILCQENAPGKLTHLFSDPLGISEFVQTIRSRDVTIFYREVVLKHKIGTDLIPKEVLPNLVLYPAAGGRGIMWQELDGTRKDSAARIFMPLFFTEKLDQSLMNLLANLRWELSRAAAGANWMDPVEGGMAGAYYDYITYYKKNPDLSTDAKEALKDFIIRYRTEKDRFADDYKSWILYEYEFKNRLNAVTRGLFYRWCPFRKPVREQLAKKAVYADHEVRYGNRVRKELLSMETKIRKFEKANLPLPEEIKNWIEVLNG